MITGGRAVHRFDSQVQMSSSGRREREFIAGVARCFHVVSGINNAAARLRTIRLPTAERKALCHLRDQIGGYRRDLSCYAVLFRVAKTEIADSGGTNSTGPPEEAMRDATGETRQSKDIKTSLRLHQIASQDYNATEPTRRNKDTEKSGTLTLVWRIKTKTLDNQQDGH